MTDALPDRIRVKLREVGECWEWTGADDGRGYGAVRWEGRTHKAHRVIYQMLIGEIPAGLELDHLNPPGCVGKHCCRPEHLEAVPHHTNLMRGNSPAALHARQTHCKHGHVLPPRDPFVRQPQRRCAECKTIYNRSRYSA